MSASWREHRVEDETQVNGCRGRVRENDDIKHDTVLEW